MKSGTGTVLSPNLVTGAKRRNLAPLSWLLVIAGTALLFSINYFAHPAHPVRAAEDNGWWQWWDQGLYLKATLAWLTFDISAPQHWYFEGYPLLGAISYFFYRADPFFAVNLASFAVSALLLCALFQKLKVPFLVTGAAFIAAHLVSQPLMLSWIVPWSSTPSTALILTSFFLAFRIVETNRPFDAFLFGLVCGSVVWFRPLDGFLTFAVQAAILWLNSSLLRRPSFVAAVVAGAGFALAACGLAAVHVLVYGLQTSPYMEMSAAFGLSVKLIPQKWVEVVIGPNPLVDGDGLISRLPWIITGIIGFVAAMLSDTTRWRQHAIIGATTIALTASFLAYRDLHAAMIWRYGLIHYFKPLFLVCIGYSLIIGVLLIQRKIMTLGAATIAAALLLAWRVDLKPVDPNGARIEIRDSKATAVFPTGFSSWRDLALVHMAPGLDFHRNEPNMLRIDGRDTRPFFDFYLEARGDDFWIFPVRDLAGGEARMALSDKYKLNEQTIRRYRRSIAFGLPCIVAKCELKN